MYIVDLLYYMEIMFEELAKLLNFNVRHKAGSFGLCAGLGTLVALPFAGDI